MTALAKKCTWLLIVCGFCTTAAAQRFELYTPYTKISVPPGQSVDYPIDVINKDSTVKTAELSVTGLPKAWTFQLKSGNLVVDQVSVLPGDKKSFVLHVQVPLRVNKGAYHFRVSARGLSRLPLAVEVSQQGAFRTEFTIDQPNMAGAAKSTFTFNAKLQNSTTTNQVYALNALAPPGWTVAFKANYKQVSSVSVDAGRTQDVTIDVNPPEQVPAGTYNLPVVASTGSTSADLALQIGITGSYGLQLTTATGLLSTTVTAGDDRRVELTAKNTGSAPLKDVSLQFNAPPNWNVTFDPSKIENLPAGQSAEVFATIQPDQKAIAGDYMANLEAKAPETSATAPFRITVATSLLWGWCGILIILVALGSVYYLFRKYGRR